MASGRAKAIYEVATLSQLLNAQVIVIEQLKMHQGQERQKWWYAMVAERLMLRWPTITAPLPSSDSHSVQTRHYVTKESDLLALVKKLVASRVLQIGNGQLPALAQSTSLLR